MNPFAFEDICAIDAGGTSIDSKGFSEGRLRQSLFRILEGSPLCSIATVTPEGRAHINTAYFSYSDKLELYFLSHPESLHCCNLSNNSSVAVTVFSTLQQWAGPDQGCAAVR